MSLDDVPQRGRLSDGSLIVMADKHDVALIRFHGESIELGPSGELYFTATEDPTPYALLARGAGGFQRVDLTPGTWVLRRLTPAEADHVRHGTEAAELIGLAAPSL